MPEAGDRANVLLVDDREDKRMAIETIIEDLDLNLVQASSGREALRHLMKQEFALILLDVNMPGMDGFETAHLIRERKSLENVPIIFISAISDTETHVSQGYSLGAVDYILAPIIPEILRAKVSVFVELFKTTEQVKRQADDLRLAHSQLERRVNERTAELAIANESLQAQIREREKAEENLQKLNTELEHRVLLRTEELQNANQELETFNYSIAHDLRAPFRQIHGYAGILQEEFVETLPDEAKKYISRIGSKAKDMEQMVDDLLKLFGITKLKVEYHRVSLAEIAIEISSRLEKESKGRKFDWKIGDLPTMHCNQALVRQIFENLLSNAVKYTRPRGVARIEIGYRKIESEDVIFICDNGVGFDMENSPRLFGIFQRLHRAEDFEGTGVGLALVSRIVQKHGGKIWAESQLNQGATFYFTLGKGRVYATSDTFSSISQS